MKNATVPKRQRRNTSGEQPQADTVARTNAQELCHVVGVVGVAVVLDGCRVVVVVSVVIVSF